MLQIDGSLLEGGGQVVRIAMALSAVLHKTIQIINIRSKRSQAGLRAQHLIGLQLVRDISNGQLIGDRFGSTQITFNPNYLSCGQFFGDTKTAGSVSLLFQTSLPCLLYTNETSYLRLKGGTNAEMAPQIDYIQLVLKPLLEKFNIHFETEIIRRGYYPKGGGEVVFKVDPIEYIKCVELTEFGKLIKITGYSFVAGVLPMKIAHSMADSAINLIREAFPGVSIEINRVQESYDKAFGNGTGIIIIAESSNGCRMGGSALGKRGVSSESVGEAAAQQLIEDINSGGAVDRYTQDQLIIFMALASGKSLIKTGSLTMHTKTAIHFAQYISGAQFNVTQMPDTQQFMIECNGIALKNQII